MSVATVESPWKSRLDRADGRSVKKDAVLLTAARLFNERGFAGTALDDIAQSLQVTKPTLYYYITNKEQVLFECVKRGLEVLRESIRSATQQGLPARDCLRVAMENYAAVVTSDFGLCVIRVGEDPLSETLRQQMRALKREIDVEFTALIEQGMAEGSIAVGDPRIASFTVVGALSGIGRWYRPGVHGERNLQEAVQHCIAMLMHGVLHLPAGAPPAAAEAGAQGAAATRRELVVGARLVRCYAERPAHLGQLLRDALAQHPDGEALVVGTLRLTWRELCNAAARCAAGLLRRGVTRGDRVALLLRNCGEFVIVTHACAWIGAVVTPINARSRAPEVRFILADSTANLLVASAELLSEVPDEDLPALRHRVVVGGNGASAPWEPFSSLMQDRALTDIAPVDTDDLAALLYTSGTTGQPKGALLSHRAILHSALHYQQRMQLGPTDRSLIAVPMNHVTGLVAQIYTLALCQGCVVVMTQFKAAEFAALAERERMTHTLMVPAMYNLCLLLPDFAAHDWSHWRIAAFGGAPMPPATIEALAKRLPQLTLMNAYGATETASPATIMTLAPGDSRVDSVGQALPCAELCVVDEAGREVAAGEIGEIWIKGPMVALGYWNNPAASASEFVDAYWRSGDMGTLDALGYLRILDRKKDVINRGGYKVFGAEVENVLARHPAVLESAIVGVPCAVLGERVHAFVCVRALDASTQAQALAALCSAELSDYKVPETWTIGTDPLPRNPNGKVMKRELRRTMHTALS